MAATTQTMVGSGGDEVVRAKKKDSGTVYALKIMDSSLQFHSSSLIKTKIVSCFNSSLKLVVMTTELLCYACSSNN